MATDLTKGAILKMKFFELKKFHINRDLAFECIKEKPILLSQFKHLDFYRDEEFLIDACSINPVVIRYIDIKLKKNLNFMIKLSKIQNAVVLCYKYASYNIQNNKEFKLNLINTDIKATIELDSSYFYNEFDIISTGIKKDAEVFKVSNIYIKQNLDLVKKLVEINPLIFEFVSNEFKRNQELVRIAIKKDGIVLKFLTKFNLTQALIAIISNNQIINFLISNEIYNTIFSKIKYLLTTNNSIKLFLISSSFCMYHQKLMLNQNKYAKTTDTNILNKLNHHGPHFGLIFKKKIIEYIDKETLPKTKYILYRMAAINIQNFFKMT